MGRMMEQGTIRTAFIGLGSQGGPMAERMLAGGYPLTVWARRPEATETFVAQGATLAGSVEALGRQADHVGVCVVNDAGVDQVCDTLLPAMRPGSLLAIHATILPQHCEVLAHRCAAFGIAFVDAPVSGGGQAAAAGKLTVMCGGEAAAFEQARPVFETFAGTLVHLGLAGSGQRAKLINNALMAANMGLAQAALMAAEELAIDRQAVAKLVKASSGRSFGFEVFARLPEPSSFAHGAALLRKDVDLLCEILPNAVSSARLTASASPFLDSALNAATQSG